MATVSRVTNRADRYRETLQWVLPQESSDETIRPDVIGRQLQVLLYGLCLGLFVLSPALASSNRRVKGFLCFIMLLNTFYTALRAEHLTAISTNQHRDADYTYAYTPVPDVLVVFPYIGITASVQVFLAVRVIKILPNKLAKGLWLAVFVLALITAIFFWVAGPITDEVFLFLGLVPAWSFPYGFLETYGGETFLCVAAFIDIFIAVTLGVLLYREIAGFNKGTDSTLRRILRVTLATGALTSAGALSAAIVALASSGADESFLILEAPLPSLYCLSVFWTLDLRSRLLDEQRRRDLQLSLGSLTNGTAPDATGGESRQCPSNITGETLQVYLGAPFKIEGHSDPGEEFHNEAAPVSMVSEQLPNATKANALAA